MPVWGHRRPIRHLRAHPRHLRAPEAGVGTRGGSGRTWVCALTAAPHRGAEPAAAACDPPLGAARTHTRTRRAFTASRWNSYAAKPHRTYAHRGPASGL
jgi:hypothetical protein